MVARILRGQGYRLAARHLVADRAELGSLDARAKELGALVAINGDYHRLRGFCRGTVFSTLIADGSPDVVGSPFDYACQWWLSAEGVPHAGALELGAELVLPDGRALPAFRNLDDPVGKPIVIDRHPKQAWTAPGYLALPVRAEGRRYRVTGALVAPGDRLRGAAVLAPSDSPAAATLAAQPRGAVLELRLTGAAAGRTPLALGTGPRLVRDGAAAPGLDRPEWAKPVGRAAVGHDAHHVLLVVTPSNAGLSLPDFAAALVSLGCHDAVNLDGGPSPTLWVREDDRRGRIVNGARRRPLGSGLFVLPPDATEGTPLR